MFKWRSLSALWVLGTAVACATATNTEGLGVGGDPASDGGSDVIVSGAGDSSMVVSAGGGSSSGGAPSGGGSPGAGSGGTSHLAFGGGTGMSGSGGTGGVLSTAGSSSGGSSGTSSGGAAGTGAGGSSGAGTAGGTGAGCVGLPMWDGGNYMFTPKKGTEIQDKGMKYKAAQDISYPNPECDPSAPAAYCSGWFTAEGPC